MTPACWPGELAAGEGGGGVGEAGQAAGELDPGVGGAGADARRAARPAGRAQAHGRLLAGLPGRPVEGADGAGDGGVHAVLLGEGDAQQVGQLAHVERAGGAPEGADDLVHVGSEEL